MHCAFCHHFDTTRWKMWRLTDVLLSLLLLTFQLSSTRNKYTRRVQEKATVLAKGKKTPTGLTTKKKGKVRNDWRNGHPNEQLRVTLFFLPFQRQKSRSLHSTQGIEIISGGDIIKRLQQGCKKYKKNRTRHKTAQHAFLFPTCWYLPAFMFSADIST